MPGPHLTPFERMQIQVSLQNGRCAAEIAKDLGRHRSTISRELKRAAGGLHRTYSAIRGQCRYVLLRAAGGRPILAENEPLINTVEALLEKKWSPEQIASRLPIDFPKDSSMRISHETIYLHVYRDKKAGGSLYLHLRQSHKRRKKRGQLKGKRGVFNDRVSIENRPGIVDKQRRIGDGEGDTLFGKGHAHPLATFVDRKSLYTLAAPMPNKSADALHRATLDAFKNIPPSLCRTLTVDNGKEFAHFKAIESDLGCQVYFAHPYTATERAINENTNGLLRQYLPKKTDFNKLTAAELKDILNALNNRPRKKLGYRTPKEVFTKACVALRS